MIDDREDLSVSYSARLEEGGRSNAVQEAEAWLADFQAGDRTGKPVESFPYIEPKPIETRPLPEPKPARAKTDDSLGRKQPKGASDSYVKQAVGGVEDAMVNSGIFGAVDGLANWLNDNVADLRYGRVEPPKTASGSFVRKFSEFMTGFIPALKGMKAIGVTGSIAQPTAAGAIADFVVRDPHEGRLADLWNQAGLPKNILTDYLASNPDDTQAEARFKNSAEGVLTGLVLEGVLQGARMIRAARSAPGVKQSEEQILRDKYGAVTEGEIGAGAKGVESEYVVRIPEVDEKRRGFLKAMGALAASKVVPGIRGVDDEAGAAIREMNALQNMDEAFKMGYGGGPTEEALLKSGLFTKDADGLLSSTDAFLSNSAAKNAQLIRAAQAELEAGAAVTVTKSVDKNIKRTVGDTSKPLIETGPRGKSLVNKTKAAGEELPDLDPRALIRGRKGEILPEDFQVYVNFARIDEPEQVKFVIGKMAEAMKGHIDDATRGVVTQKETEKLAGELGMTVSDLLARRKGQPFNAEEALAARNLWAASGDKLLELAKKANSENAGSLDQFAFRRQMAVHAAIQAEVLGGRAETARSLASWRIEAGRGSMGDIARARAIKQIMDATGGDKTSKELARRLSILAESGADPAMIGKFAERGYGEASVDAVKELWINGLLSSPKTHVVNVMSNTGVAFQQIYERAAAGQIRNLVGGEGVVAGEATAMAYGLMEGLKDAFRLSAKALKTGESMHAFNKVDLVRTNSVSAEAFRMSKETGLGRAVDFLGTVTNVPGRLLQAEDEFFKTIGYRMELHAQALRQATSEGLTGKDAADRMAVLVRNPPETLTINAADAALYNTFTNDMGWFGRSVMNMRQAGDAVNPLFLVLPFVRTPVNIARYAFERTPFAPLVGQWRADVAAGGARADLALARMSTGTAIMAVALDLADNGIVSGKGPSEGKTAERESLQRQGWQPYSVKVGDRWYSYNRADPFGMTMGFAADIAESMKRGEIDHEDIDEWQEVVAMAVAAVSQVTISKTYLEGFANMVETLMEPKRRTKQYVEDLMASFLPATSLMAGVKNMVDPVRRETESPADAIRARIAGLSQSLPPRRNLWGEEITTESGLGRVHDFVSPVASKQQVDSPIDREMQLRGAGVERIGKRTPFDGVDMNLRHYPRAYDDYTRLAGNGLKHPAWGMGAKDFLNAVVSGAHPLSASYKVMPDEARKQFIQSTITEYRKLAQREVLSNPQHKGFAAEHAYLKGNQQQNRLPVLGE